MKSKILFILPLPPPVHGSSIMGQIIRDSRRINEVFDCDFINLLTSRNINEIGNKSISKLFRFIFILLQTIYKLLIGRYDLCYIAINSNGGGFYKDSIVVFFVKLFHKNKLVFHLHNKGVHSYQHKSFYNILYKRVFKSANVILLSHNLYSDIKKYVPIEKVFICPNGIKDMDASRNLTVCKNHQPVNILFLSNLMVSKGVFVLVEACSILKKRGIAFKCNFVGAEGDIKKKQLVLEIINKNLQNDVSYLGSKYGCEKDICFRQADIFAFPTYYDYETFGLVLVEAMQHSLPVVSTFEGGIPDVVEDGVTGFLAPQRNVKTLADKLELLINDQSLRKTMGRSGYLKYQKEFTSEKFEGRFINILNKIINSL